MTVVYVAGPYKAGNQWLIERNIRRAEELALLVACRGAAAICPHTMARYFWGTLPEADWIAMDLELLGRCDALLLVEGWESSRGTKTEIAHAKAKGMPVFQSLGDLVEWMDQEVEA